ncbi:MAG: hypothetical protein LBG48_00305 [Rickettsiales bacterium]|jgi:hypothetical protein|nr:hypothetical protein [Rickettsiales bacterium]
MQQRNIFIGRTDLDGSEYVEIPGQQIKETEKAVSYQWTIYNKKTDAESKEVVWFPKSMLRNGKVPQWLLQKKRDEIHQKIDEGDYDKFLLAVRRPSGRYTIHNYKQNVYISDVDNVWAEDIRQSKKDEEERIKKNQELKKEWEIQRQKRIEKLNNLRISDPREYKRLTTGMPIKIQNIETVSEIDRMIENQWKAIEMYELGQDYVTQDMRYKDMLKNLEYMLLRKKELKNEKLDNKKLENKYFKSKIIKDSKRLLTTNLKEMLEKNKLEQKQNLLEMELLEKSLSRLMYNLQKREACFITAFKNKEVLVELGLAKENDSSKQIQELNEKRNKELEKDLQNLHYGYLKVEGSYFNEDDIEEVENSFVAFNVDYSKEDKKDPDRINSEKFKNKMLNLCGKYNQESILLTAPITVNSVISGNAKVDVRGGEDKKMNVKKDKTFKVEAAYYDKKGNKLDWGALNAIDLSPSDLNKYFSKIMGIKFTLINITGKIEEAKRKGMIHNSELYHKEFHKKHCLREYGTYENEGKGNATELERENFLNIVQSWINQGVIGKNLKIKIYEKFGDEVIYPLCQAKWSSPFLRETPLKESSIEELLNYMFKYKTAVIATGNLEIRDDLERLRYPYFIVGNLFIIYKFLNANSELFDNVIQVFQNRYRQKVVLFTNPDGNNKFKRTYSYNCKNSEDNTSIIDNIMEKIINGQSLGLIVTHNPTYASGFFSLHGQSCSIINFLDQKTNS